MLDPNLLELVNEFMLSDKPDIWLELLREWGGLHLAFPNVVPIVGFGGLKHGHKDLWAHTKQVVKQAPARRAVRFAALYHDVGKPSSFKRDARGRVMFHMHEVRSHQLFAEDVARHPDLYPDPIESKRMLDLVLLLGQVEAYDVEWSDTALLRLHTQAGELWDDLCDLARADVTSARPGRREHIVQAVDAMDARLKALLAENRRKAATKLPKGVGLVIARELKLNPGRELGAWMKRLESAVAAGTVPVHADPEGYVGWVHEQRSGLP